MGVPQVWVRDTDRHFKNRAFQLVVETLRTRHRFAAANLLGASGTVKRMMRGIVRTLKALFNEGRRPLVDSVQVVPVVQ